ncbi:MAG: peptidylprolyl isomerase [Rhodoferax sp.]
MKIRFLTVWLVLVLLASSLVRAQSSAANADYIVALVNSDPITNQEVRRDAARLRQQLAQQSQSLPADDVFVREVLDTLIERQLQLQLAREIGIKADAQTIDQAEQAIARQNGFDVAELHRRVQADGQTPAEFRAELGNQIVLQRLREREVEGRVRVSDLEVDQYLLEQQSVTDLSRWAFNIGQVLVAVPDAASPDQVQALQAKAQQIQAQAAAGADFAALARSNSDATEAATGGALGLRTADRYPPLFVQALRDLPEGGVSPVLRSGAGFHVLKLLEKINRDLPAPRMTQTHARHILRVPSVTLNQTAALRELEALRQRIQRGEVDFAQAARAQSQDGSAARGGDLGWANPGQFVPEFEAVLARLAPGQIAPPFVSRFGVHLVQLLERREVATTSQQQRAAVRERLLAKKQAEALRTWIQELRDRAYIELREAPQL